MQAEVTLELPLFRVAPGDPNVRTLRALLHEHGWLKRDDLVDETGWAERSVRALLDAMGTDVVRSTRRGFKLFDDLTDGEIGLALEAAEFAIAQAKHQGNYGVRLKRRIHGRVG